MISFRRIAKKHYDAVITALAAAGDLDHDDRLLDLVGLVDDAAFEGKRVPGEVQLAARWQVSGRQARKVLDDPRWREWFATLYRDRQIPERRGSGEEAVSERRGSGEEAVRSDTPQRQESSQIGEEAVSERRGSGEEAVSERRGGPESGQVEPGVSTPSSTEYRVPSTEQDVVRPAKASSREPKPKSKLDADYDRVCDYIVSTFSEAIGITRPQRPNKATVRGKRLLAALRADPDQALDAFRCVAEGSDAFPRTRHLAGRYPRISVESVLDRVDHYAELWRTEQDEPANGVPQYDTPPPPANGGIPRPAPGGST